MKRKRGKAGFSRFKQDGGTAHSTYPELGFKFAPNGRIQFSKEVDEFRVFMYRRPEGRVETLTVKRDGAGDWFIILTTEHPDPIPKPQAANSVGVDLGLERLAALSTGEYVEPPRLFAKTQGGL